MKKIIKNIKEKLDKKPKLKKFLNVFSFVLTINSYLFNIFFVICIIVGANLSEVDYKPNIIYQKNDVVKKAVDNDYDGFSEDSSYYYFNRSCMNVAFIDYLESLVTQGVIYHNQNVTQFSYYLAQTHTTARNVNKVSIANSGTGPNTLTFKDSSNSDRNLSFLLSVANSPYVVMGSSTQSAIYYSVYQIRVLKSSTDVGKWFYDAYINSRGGDYTEADITNAYNEGFADGVASHVAPVVDSELVIHPNYDFRKLISNSVDKDYGFIQINSLSSATPLDMYEYCFSGGSSWNVGTKRYNAIVLTVLCLDDSQALSYNGSKTDYAYVSDIKGSSGVKIFGLARVDYIYIEEIESESTWQKVGDGVNYLTEADYFANIYTYETLLTGLNDNSKPSLLANFYNIKWNDNGFRVLTNFDSDNTIVKVPQFNTLTMNELLTLNDKYITNNDSTTANAFTLLSSAFRATANILNIQILPNITIGILLFIPLIVTIVLFIVKLLRK